MGNWLVNITVYLLPSGWQNKGCPTHDAEVPVPTREGSIHWLVQTLNWMSEWRTYNKSQLL